MIIFGAPDCPLCEKLVAQLSDFSTKWSALVETVYVDRYATRSPNNGSGPAGWTYAISPNAELHALFDASVNPFAFIVDSNAEVCARGLVNTLEDLEHLVAHARDAGAIGLEVSASTEERLIVPAVTTTTETHHVLTRESHV